MKFLHPEYFWLLVLFIPMFLFFETRPFWTGRSITYSCLDLLPKTFFSLALLARTLLVVVKIAVMILLTAVLARPQISVSVQNQKAKGISIVLSLDISGSMRAEDFSPKNRIQAAKDVIADFIKGLPGQDRVGLVVFAGRSFTQCPLTVDKEIILYFLKQVEVGETIMVDGTAMGDGLVNAVNILDKEPGRSKVIILASDGVSNTGVSPLAAGKLATTKGIKVYTIGMGKKGGAPLPYLDMYGRKQYFLDRRTGRPYLAEEPDEKTLSTIAEISGGQYFRAIGLEKLTEVYKEIGRMTKEEFKEKTYSQLQDDYAPILIAAILLLLVYYVLIKIPFNILPV